MRTVTLFIAMSLDGYIADSRGGVDWLAGHAPEGDDMSSYEDFIKDIDTVIMGANTYRQIVQELSQDDWVYHGLNTYVVTHHPKPSTAEIQFVNEDPGALARRLRCAPGKGIWICGGASVVQRCMEADLIDRFYISVIPTLLGGGIRLFDTMEAERKLKLMETRSYNGITDLVYERRSCRLTGKR